MEIFTLTLTLSLKGEGIAELRKSYLIQTTPSVPDGKGQLSANIRRFGEGAQ